MKKISILFISIVLLFSLAFSSAAYSFGVGKIINNERPDIGEYKKVIEDNNGYYIGKDTKEIYLTFDCGYENGYTEQILDELKENNVKASFFITGHYLNSATDIVKRMIDEGHLVCNHTNKHKHFTNETNEMILEDISSLEKMYKEKTGYSLPKIVRPPAGEFTATSQKLLSEHGYTSVFWSLAYVDWQKDLYYGNDYSYNNVMSKIHNGAIILMHAVSKDNAQDLGKILSKLKNDGYSFSLVNNLEK